MKRSRCVAIVGVSCRFPGGETVDEFWDTLLNGRNVVQKVPADRWNVEAYYSPDRDEPAKTYIQHAALLKDIRTFDNKIFNITDDEARYMDVQHKLALEVAYKALEDAGMSMDDVRGSKTAVFMGQMNDDYSRSIDMDEVVNYSATGLGRALVANRVSYHFDLRGPSATIDTACSSALMCLHLGVQSILSGESVMAVCGGVSAILSPAANLGLSKSRMASLTGQCYTFSDRADGYVRGEGCGVIIVKQLDQAIRDHDHIRCLITTGANQDGATVSPITTPSSVQQEALIRGVYEAAEIQMEWIDVIEAHGTGTKAGDPIETLALGNTIGAARRRAGKGPCVIGSVKTNIGHLESAAGVSGITKALLMLKHKKVVPSLHFDTPNPYIDFAGLHLSVSTKVADWPATDGKKPNFVCVNSFGYGGSNIHAVLEDYTGQTVTTKDNPHTSARPWPILFSAASSAALLATLKHTRDYVESSYCELKALSYTSSARRMHFRFRTTFLVNSIDEFKTAADQRLKSLQPSAGSRDVPVVFAFSGMGTTYAGMGRELLRLEPVFADSLKELDDLIKEFNGWSVLERIHGDEQALASPEFSQPALFAVQVSLAKLLKSWGISPSAIIGHSVGEVAAAHVSGRLSLEDATRVICRRGQVMSKVSGGSMMVAENFPSGYVEKLVQKYPSRVSIAAFNSTNCFTLSGDRDAIDAIENELKTVQVAGSQVLLKKLNVNTAFHSHHMDPIKDELRRLLAGIQQLENVSGATKIPVYSTVTGKQAVHGDLTEPEYWVKNARGCVLFQQAFAECLKATGATASIIIEIGPRPALGRYMRSVAADLNAKSTVLTTMKPPNEARELYTTLTKLFEEGIDVKWKRVFDGNETELCPVPQYQYQKKDLWHDVRRFQKFRAGIQIDVANSESSADSLPHCFLRKLADMESSFVVDLDAPETRFVNEHQLANKPTVPGAMYLECGLAAVWLSVKARLDRVDLSVNFTRLLMLSESSDKTKTMEVSLSRRGSWATDQTSKGDSFDYEIVSNGILHASGIAEICSAPCTVPSPLNLQEVRCRCTRVVDQLAFYDRLSLMNFSYGMQFRVVKSCLCSDPEVGECLATIDVCERVTNLFPLSVLHPCLGDAVLQLSCVMLSGINNSQQMVPRSIRKVKVFRLPEGSMFIHLKRTTSSTDSRLLMYNATMVNKYGEVYVTFNDVTISATDADIQCHPGDCLYLLEWKQHVASEDPVEKFIRKEQRSIRDAARYIVFEDKMGIARRVVDSLKQEGVACSDYAYIRAERSFVQQLHADMLQFNKSLPRPLSDYQGILYFWPLEALLFEHMSADEVQTVITDACFSLCQIVKCLMLARLETPITVVTKSVGELMHNSPGVGCNNRDYSHETDNKTKTNLLHGVACYTVHTVARTLTLEPGCPPIGCIDLTNCDENDIRFLKQQLLLSDKHQLPEISFFQGKIWKPELVPGSGPFQSLVRQVKHSPNVQYEAVKTNDERYILVPSNDLKAANRPVNNGHTYIQCDVIKLRVDMNDLLHDKRKADDESAQTVAADVLAQMPLVGRKTKENKVHVLGPNCLDSTQYVDSRRCVPYSLFPIDQPVISMVYLTWYIAECTKAGKLLARSQTDIACHDATAECQYIMHMLEDLFKKKEKIRTRKDSSLKVKLVVAKKLQDLQTLLKSKETPGKTHFLVLTNVVGVPAKHSLTPESLEMFEVLCVPRLFELENARFFEKFRHWLKNQATWLGQWKDSRSFDFEIRTLNSTNKCSIEIANGNGNEENVSSLAMLDFSLYSEAVPLALSTSALFRSTSRYIIIGGSRGLGWELIKFMASVGAKNLMSWSRKPPENNIKEEALALERQHTCKILFREVNVSSKEEVKRELEKSGADLFPGTDLGGIFHGAVVLEDTAVISMDLDRYTRALLPKVKGTWNLHQLTKMQPLEYFVLHSSIAAVIGNPGQTNYAAGNAFQDALAVYRRRIGLSGQSINWSSLAVGVIQNSQIAIMRSKAMGLALLTVTEICECFNFALLSNQSRCMFAQIAWRTLLKKGLKEEAYYRRMYLFPFYIKRYERFIQMSIKTSEKSADETNTTNTSDQGVADNVRIYIRQVFAENVPGYDDNPSDTVDGFELGADSLNFIGIVNKIRQQYNVPDSDLQGTEFPTLTVDRMYSVVTKYVKPSSTDRKTEVQSTKSQQQEQKQQQPRIQEVETRL